MLKIHAMQVPIFPIEVYREIRGVLPVFFVYGLVLIFLLIVELDPTAAEPVTNLTFFI